MSRALRTSTAGERRTLAVLALAGACVTGCGRLSLTDIAPGGGPGDPGPGDPEPPPPLGVQVSLGLTSLAAGDGLLRVDWRPPAAEVAEPDLALLVAPEGEPLLQAHPIRVVPGAGTHLLEGLPNGVTYELALGRSSGEDQPYLPVGATLRARTGAPIYVDPATETPGDGSSPDAPLDDPVLAVLQAFTFGGGNVWLAAGDYPDLSLPMFAGVDVYGGFAPGFEPKARDPQQHATRLLGLDGLAVVSMLQGTGRATLDGVEIDGQGLSPVGLQIEESSFEARALHVQGCRRGLTVTNSPGADTIEVLVVASTLRANELEGLSGEGSIDLEVDGCALLDNVQEGLDFDMWTAPPGETVELTARGSSFARNGADGFDIDLDVPAGSGTNGGRFRVRIERCDFQENGLVGLLIDLDYETAPEWSADIVVRGCLARANGESGVRLDLDSTATAFVHRLTGSANAEHGFLATSESAPGMLTLSACSFTGNLLDGARADLGNYGMLVSHCLVSGNQAGGLASPVAPGSVASSLAYLQPAPFGGLRQRGAVQQAESLPVPFVHAAREYGRVLAADGGQLTLAAPPSGTPGQRVELADDGQAREVEGVAGALVTVDPAPNVLTLPSTVGWFAPEEPVAEDLRLPPGSIGVGAGMTPPAGAAVDAGVFGSPAGGPPADEEQPSADLFFLARCTPPWSLPIAGDAELALELRGGPVDPDTLPLGLVLRDPAGAPIAADAWVVDDEVRVAAPPGGWQTGMLLELHGTLLSIDGRPLSAPVAVPIVRG